MISKANFSKLGIGYWSKLRRHCFQLLGKSELLGLPIDVQLKLFDTMIAPILLYGSEVWGFENCEVIEAYYFKFCKLMLHLKPSTPKVMVYGELGRFPMTVFIQTRMINFLSKIVCGKEDKLSYRLYKILHYLSDHGNFHSPWLSSVRNSGQPINQVHRALLVFGLPS